MPTSYNPSCPNSSEYVDMTKKVVPIKNQNPNVLPRESVMYAGQNQGLSNKYTAAPLDQSKNKSTYVALSEIQQPKSCTYKPLAQEQYVPQPSRSYPLKSLQPQYPADQPQYHQYQNTTIEAPIQRSYYRQKELTPNKQYCEQITSNTASNPDYYEKGQSSNFAQGYGR